MSADRLALLHSLAFTAVRLSTAELEPFTARLILSLSPPPPEDDGGLRARMSQRLREHGQVFHNLLRDALQQSLLAAIEAAAEQGRAALKSGALDLSAENFEAMQRRVQLENRAQALDKAHADRLAVLGMRITHCLSPETLRSIPNPFRAQVFLEAAADAWSKFEREPGSLAVFIAQLRPALFLPLGILYEALNRELQARGVLPDAEQRYQTEIPELTVAVTPSPRDMLQAWLAPEGTLKLIQDRAADLTDGMFEQMANDQRLPFRARKWLALAGQALAPQLRADSDFFFGTRHPARSMLAALYDAGLASGDGNDAVSHALAAASQRLVDAPQELPLAEQDLRQALEAMDRDHAGLLETYKTEALQQEAGAAALRDAHADIDARLETGEVDVLVEDFLRQRWIQVLSFARRVQETKPDLLPAVIRAMDQLVWSLQPKHGPEERRELVEQLPGLLSTLNAWMNVIKWQGEEREAFFTALADRHAATLRPGDARQALEQRMETVRKASEHQLDRRASEQAAAADAEFLPAVDALAPGAWVELVRNNGNPVNCRLCWVSPQRSRLVFIVPQRRRIFMLRAEELARAMRAQRATVLDTAAWVDEKLFAALAVLRG